MSITQDMKVNRLPAKYNHLFIFGYWLLKQQHHSPSLRNTYMDQFYCEGNINDQMKIFDEFWSNRKEIEKLMKGKKRSGRPKKLKKEVVFDHGDDLLRQLIEEAQKEIQGGMKSQVESNEQCNFQKN